MAFILVLVGTALSAPRSSGMKPRSSELFTVGGDQDKSEDACFSFCVKGKGAAEGIRRWPCQDVGILGKFVALRESGSSLQTVKNGSGPGHPQ